MYENWIGDQEIQSGYGEPVYDDVGLIRDLLDKWLVAYRSDEFYRWAIVLKENQANIGQIAFCHVDLEHNFADLEYCLGRSYQGKGYAGEALAAVISFTFEQTGLNRLQAFHRGRNVSSARLLQQSALLYEGTLKQSFYYSDTGEYDDRVYYGITRADYLR